MRGRKESRLVYEIMRDLGKHGAVYRTMAGSAKLPDGTTFKGMPKGFSDIMLIAPGGRACFIEAKVKPNKATPEQDAFIAKMRLLGARAGVAHSVEEARDICGVGGAEPPGGEPDAENGKEVRHGRHGQGPDRGDNQATGRRNDSRAHPDCAGGCGAGRGGKE
jgi:hypothetical protein